MTHASNEQRRRPGRAGAQATTAPPEHDRDALQAFVVDTARLLRDRHCEDIVVFDVRDLSPLTEYVVLATGTSDRQMKAVGREVADLAQTNGHARYGSERDQSATWVVLDFVNVMIHLFEPTTRAHYDLEMMWGDAPRIDWQRRL